MIDRLTTYENIKEEMQDVAVVDLPSDTQFAKEFTKDGIKLGMSSEDILVVIDAYTKYVCDRTYNVIS